MLESEKEVKRHRVLIPNRLHNLIPSFYFTHFILPRLYQTLTTFASTLTDWINLLILCFDTPDYITAIRTASTNSRTFPQKNVIINYGNKVAV